MRRRAVGASRQAATGGPLANGRAYGRLGTGGVSRKETVGRIVIAASATIDSGDAGAATGAGPQQTPRQVHDGVVLSGAGCECP